MSPKGTDAVSQCPECGSLYLVPDGETWRCIDCGTESIKRILHHFDEPWAELKQVDTAHCC